MTNQEYEHKMRLAKRVLDQIAPWDRDDDKTEDEQITEIFNDFATQPEYIVEFLLDTIDCLQA